MNQPAAIIGIPRQSTYVYEALRLAIVSGELRPNEPLIEDAIAGKYGTSRTPLREAIQRLAADGLLVPRRRGWAVREFTPEEIRQNYEVRSSLEGLASRVAAERGTQAQHALIARIQEERATMSSATPAQRLATNRAFHDAILAAAQNERLRHMIFLAGNFYLTRRVAMMTDDSYFLRAQAEHATIVTAIERRDGDAADKAMQTHIMNAYENVAPIQHGLKVGVATTFEAGNL